MLRLSNRAASTASWTWRAVAVRAAASSLSAPVLSTTRTRCGSKTPMSMRYSTVTAASIPTTAVPDKPRAEVLKIVKGQELRIPDIEKLFDGWQRLVSPHRSSVTNVVNEIVQKYAVSPKIRHRLTNNNLDLLVATWFPLASPERLAELAQFVCWMFIIDDEIDSIKQANVSIEEFKHLWSEALRVISESCGLHGHEVGAKFEPSKYQSAETFRPFGELLMTRYSFDQRQRFWDELETTANAYIQEYGFTKLDWVPDYEAYCAGRYGTSCMAQNLSMFEYSNESNIPQELMESPELKSLWKQTTDLLWM
ncbi:isoprenoid synthase domain-containing protein [Microdochium trichocladiopsis]|uniref:Isoprenoid synthase domain-containing protein n=1 Tax=Microdochium trichocladiopsis TaxID=1682393 RepID=A0A9P8YJ67_9PEZI|nr:isoprenoid synthase domain-containing protein [Microdochium trichocladiopsis]KAH7040893.1 isoprenoid synthase domain-containing protein [Microdochium trichocladiopsis]